MSYEKKLKDLLDRLVAMSPEPPPYPEETPMAGRDETGKRPHPALVFVGAAAIVAALAVPVILLTGGETPVAGDSTTTTTVPTTSTAPAETSTTRAPTTTMPPTSTTAASVWQGVVFLYQEPENSFLQNPALIPAFLEVTDPSTDLRSGSHFTEVLAALGDDLPSSMANAIPPQVQIVNLSAGTADGREVWIADMSEAFLDGAGGLLADTTMLNQLIYSITYGEGAEGGVLFTVNDEPVEAYGSEGIDLTEPVDRDTFIDEIGLIFLTEPIMEAEHVYLVSGMANTFEASLTVRVVDANGETLHEEPVQASCGSGCWGEFGVGVDSDLITPGQSSIQLFTYSAEDGSMTDVITVPIPDNGIWEMSLD